MRWKGESRQVWKECVEGKWCLEQQCYFGGRSRDEDVEVLFGKKQDGEDQDQEKQLMLRL